MSKKGSKGSKADVSSYEISDIVLGKVRGFPPWPGRVVDPESAPEQVKRERPSNKKSVFYCVQFFPTGDFSWLPPKEISKLKPHEIESYITDPVRRSGDLLEGYKIARDPKQWAEDRANAAAGDDDAEAEQDDEMDELDEDGNERVATKKKRKAPATASASSTTAKKRKRDSEPGTTASAKGKGSTSSSAAKGKGSRKKSKAAVESEDEAAEDGDGDDAAKSVSKGSPPSKKTKKDTAAASAAGKEDNADDAELANDPEANKVREWRHRLQKTFLSNKGGSPKPEDMPAMNDLFTQIEQYDKINIAYLSFSKIGKVMRHITALSDDKVPSDAAFKFRDRAKVLVDRWQQIINASRGDTNAKESKAANGTQGFSPNEQGSGIADAINSSIAGGVAQEEDEQLVNGTNGHVNGAHGLGPSASNASINTHNGDGGDMSILPDVTMSEIGVE